MTTSVPLSRKPAARRSGDGVATVLPSCGSATLRGLAQASGLVVVSPTGAAAGDEVEYLPLPASQGRMAVGILVIHGRKDVNDSMGWTER